MALTITIPGAVETTTGSTAPAVLTVGVGAPGVGVPSGGSTGQYLVKASATSYDTAWLTLPANYITSVTAPLAVTSGNLAVDLSAYLTTATAASTYLTTAAAASTYQTQAAMSSYLTTATAASTYQTQAAMSSYLTSATAASTYAVIAAGQPVSGTVGQVLTKNSGTNYDSSWATLVPGDRYLTTSATSLAISTGAKTLTVGTGLSYSSQQDVIIAYDATHHMHAVVTSYNSSTGVMVVDVQNKTGTGTYTAWTVNVGGTVPLQSVAWGEIVGTLGDQSDLATALNNKLETSTAASTYAALSGAIFTGEVSTPASTTATAGFSILPGTAPTSPTNGEFWNTGSDLQVRLGGVTETLAEQSWVTTQLGSYLTTASAASTYQTQAGMSSYLTTATAASTYAALAGANFTGLVSTPASTTTTAGLRVAHGAAPTSPVNGDIWTTTGAVFARINGGTTQLMNLGSTQTVSGSITFSNANQTLGNSTAASTINVGTGATVTATTKAVNIGTNGVAGSTTNIAIGTTSGGTNAITINGPTTFSSSITAANNSITLGSGTATSVFNFGNGATLSGSTKAVEIGTQGAAGSTTTIAIGGTAGTSTTTLNGTTNGVTAAADTNSVALATTAYVVGQAGSATPLVDGTAAVGTSLRYARQDHVHPTDTSRAALASPTFTGTPLAPTAAVDTNTTQIATTAYVVGQGYAKLASPTFTGTPTLPTGTIATTQTAGNNTTAVATTAFVTAAVPAFAATADINSPSSTTKVMSPSNVVDMLVSQNYQLLYLGAGSSGTSGTGSYFGNNGGRWHELQSANASTSGYAAWSFDTNASSRGLVATNRGGAPFSRNWSKKIWLSGRCIIGHTTVTTIDGDANTFFRCGLGGKNSFSVGDISAAINGITFKIPGGGAAMILQVSNGSAVTSVTSSFTPTVRVVFDWKIYSDGAGNVTLYVNDSQVATTTAGPTTSLDNGLYFESVESTGTNTVGFGASTFGAKIYYAV